MSSRHVGPLGEFKRGASHGRGGAAAYPLPLAAAHAAAGGGGSAKQMPVGRPAGVGARSSALAGYGADDRAHSSGADTGRGEGSEGPIRATNPVVVTPNLIAGTLGTNAWTNTGPVPSGKPTKFKIAPEPTATGAREPAVLSTEIETQARATEADNERKMLEGVKPGLRPVVFQGKVYHIEPGQTAEQAFASASLAQVAARQFAAKWDTSHVVVQPRTLAVVKATGLTEKHLRKLRAQYSEIDVTGHGNITFDEFFEFIDEKRSVFTDVIFSKIVEKAGAKVLMFDDFLIVITLYCMYSRLDIFKLLFDMFDEDKSGLIDEGEFVNLCKMVNNGNPMFPGGFEKALSNFDLDGDGSISFEEFQAMHGRFPMVLYPAFKLQDAMQQATLGSEEWVRIAARLVKLKAKQNAQQLEQLQEYTATGGRGRGRANKVEVVTCWGKVMRLLCCYYCCGRSTAAVEIAGTAEEALAKFDQKSVQQIEAQLQQLELAAATVDMSDRVRHHAVSPKPVPVAQARAMLSPPAYVGNVRATGWAPQAVTTGALSQKALGKAFGLKSFVEPKTKRPAMRV